MERVYMKKPLITAKGLIGLLLTAAIFGLFSYQTSGQTTKQSPDAKTVPVERVIRKAGWPVPEDRKTNEKSAKTVTMDGIQVRATSMPVDDKLIEIEDFYTTQSGELSISPFTCVLNAMIAYDVDGVRFAYKATYVYAYFLEREGVVHTGAATEMYYVDIDGDGIFEERRLGHDELKLST